MLETPPSLPHSLHCPIPPTSCNRCHLLNWQCWESLGGRGITRPFESDPFLGHGAEDTDSRGGWVPSHETFMLGENKDGAVFHSLVLGKGGAAKGEMRRRCVPQPVIDSFLHQRSPKPVSLIWTRLRTREGHRRRERGLMSGAVRSCRLKLNELLDARCRPRVIPAPKNISRARYTSL